MSSVEITAVVASIVSAFASGMDIFRRMRARQRPRRSKRTPERLTEDEWQLQTSLQCRPREIRAEYDRSLARLGDRFAMGDSAAQTSLNHTLLVLNTGLIQILSHALSNDTKVQALSRRSLLSLSEAAAADAVCALEQLHSRLSSAPQLTLTAPSSDKRAHRRGEEVSKAVLGSSRAGPTSKPRSKSFSNTERKRPGPDPLVRGAWVRSKSGTSVFIASSSSSGTSIPKASHHKAASPSSAPHHASFPIPSHHRTKSSPSHSSRPNYNNSSVHSPEQTFPYLDQSPPSYHASPEQQHHHRYPNRQPSLLLASPEVFTDIPPPTLSSQPPPPPPPKIPLHFPLPTPQAPPIISAIRLRPRPPSVATFLTASTKIGEIPEHRWLTHNNGNSSSSSSNNNTESTRPALPWEQQRSLPYVIPPRLEDERQPSTRKKGRGFKFWKRNEQVAVS